MGRVIGSLVISVPLTLAGLAVAWVGLLLRSESFLSFSLPPEMAEYWFLAHWLPQLPTFVVCSVLWLVAGGCILLGLGWLGEFWGVGGQRLLGIWAVAHLGTLGLGAAAISVVHPQPAVFWQEAESVLTPPVASLTLCWRLYLLLLFGVLLGSLLAIVRKKPV